MSKRRKVYKVVRQDCGRLISAILPKHLAVTYRDLSGRFRTVESSMAFRTRLAACRLARPWVASRSMPFEIWEAEATVVGPVKRRLDEMIGKKSNTPELRWASSRSLPKEAWRRLVSQVETPGRLVGTHIGEKWCGTSVRLLDVEPGVQSIVVTRNSPAGAILCKDLRLVRKDENF